MRANQIANAARQGVRAAIVGRDGYDDVDVVMLSEFVHLSTSDYTTSVSPTSVSPGEPITVTVTVQTANSKIGLINIPMLPTPTQLRASVTMAKEGRP